MTSRYRSLKQDRAEETRARILQQAREAFAEHGFAGANVRAIAQRAGTTHSMITYHFGSKDELWREAMRDMFALLQAQVFDPLEAEADLPPDQRFRHLVGRYAHYCAEHPEHARITISESIRGGERLQWMVDEFVKASHSATLPWFQSLIDQGVIRAIPLESYLYAFVGMMQLPFVLAREADLALGYDFMTQRAIDRHAEAIMALVMIQPALPA